MDTVRGMTSRSTPEIARTAICGARLVTLARPSSDRGPRRGQDLLDLGVIERGWILTEGGRFAKELVFKGLSGRGGERIWESWWPCF